MTAVVVAVPVTFSASVSLIAPVTVPAVFMVVVFPGAGPPIEAPLTTPSLVQSVIPAVAGPVLRAFRPRGGAVAGAAATVLVDPPRLKVVEVRPASAAAAGAPEPGNQALGGRVVRVVGPVLPAGLVIAARPPRLGPTGRPSTPLRPRLARPLRVAARLLAEDVRAVRPRLVGRTGPERPSRGVTETAVRALPHLVDAYKRIRLEAGRVPTLPVALVRT